MFKIKRLKIVVKTSEENFGFDEEFHEKINFIASYENTKGKSSCIEAIYYCLGLEELIGGQNERALKPVFRKILEYNNQPKIVLESEFYLELKNSRDQVITIYRTAGKENYSSNLITVYMGNIESVTSGLSITSEDMYVHLPGAATNQRGFHRFLEEFIGLILPDVPTFDNVDRKLYIQTIFSAMFIEQKRGWSNILATIPTNFRIKDVRQRVIEYIIGLHILETERQKQKCKATENRIKREWSELFAIITNQLDSIQCYFRGISRQPEVLDDDFMSRIVFFKRSVEMQDKFLNEYVIELNEKMERTKSESVKVVDNFDALEEERSISQDRAREIERSKDELNKKLVYENTAILELKKNLEIINNDLRNNKDAQKLKNMGSTQEWLITKDMCPTCHQKINDSLLPQDFNYNLMSIDENIKHLLAQKSMVEFGINGHINNINSIKQSIELLEKDLKSLNRIIRSIINDIYTVDNNLSETIVYKKIMLENEIDQITTIKSQLSMLFTEFVQLSNDWKAMLLEKKSLPTDNFTEEDIKCLNIFEKFFKAKLKEYRYSSFTNMSNVSISKDTLQPVVEGFDMKFDSSASDHIRAIWAFTNALVMAATKCKGNHPGVLIFDEPDQQSVMIADMESLLKSFVELDCQVIIGITLKEIETKNAITKIDSNTYKLIEINEKAIAPIKVIKKET